MLVAHFRRVSLRLHNNIFDGGGTEQIVGRERRGVFRIMIGSAMLD
jgi:hypothetical protein